MASKEGHQLLQGNEAGGSNDSVSNSGSSAEPKAEDKNDNRGFTGSSPAVLEPSKDEWRSSEGIGNPKNLLEKRLTSSCPQPSTQEVSISSSGESNSHEEDQQIADGYQSSNAPQTAEPRAPFCANFRNCYNNFKNCYNNNARKIRNSWFIYVFQFWVSLLIVSAIVMGIIFFQSCKGIYPSTGPTLSIIMGMSGLVLIYKWVSKVCRERRGQRYWNREKNRLAICFIIVLFLMTLEFLFFLRVSPDNAQLTKKEIKCNNIYFYYMYYLHIANAGSLVLGALLYLPDCITYIANWTHLRPSHHNGHYQPL